ncbi:acyl-CoA synthetase FdrA [Selenomonas sp. TAMA-11512]|uniref:acyl-CoA synthetase FdrA n=1 Tax=Selenomonas sp. TAMA-11512 TaxID=3095337 RepID=UPI0030913D08|nr:acyl-CoA synthetase FdrA [Selenomonas sp. TAMA-11512]
MKIFNVVRKNDYHDSVTLLLISKRLRSLVEGIDDVSVMMGTPANHGILKEAGLLGPEGEAAGPNDLIMAFRADESTDQDDIIAQIDAELKKKAAAGEEEKREIHSALVAYEEDPDTNLALISVPGEYAALEAERALNHGKHVMIFSDNVPLEDEVRVKTLAKEKGFLVMGPDCGTAIINGKGLAFANAVKDGEVGLIAASGTGLQEVTCLLDRLGIGVRQAVGTGGRDLKEAVGASTMLAALDLLNEDEKTSTIVLISKPPAASVVDKILGALKRVKKSVVICFIGAKIDTASLPSNIHVASSLEDAALQTAKILNKPNTLLDGAEKRMEAAKAAKATLTPQQKYVRALYTGGTLCYEAMLKMEETFGELYSNLAHDDHRTLEVVTAGHHSAMDLGDDDFTLGRPHPMIDGSVRDEHILRVAGDKETAVLLLDFVLGYGAAEDPAGAVLPVLDEAKELAKKAGNPLVWIAYVMGTEDDPQKREEQEEKLRAKGAIIARTNAEAVRMATMIAEGRE